MNNKADHNPVVSVENIENADSVREVRSNDVYALTLLQPLLINYPFLPFTLASLRPLCLAHILNDIVINNRQNIIEFGSGISTLIIGRLIKKNQLTTKLLSIENDESWLKKMIQTLKDEKIDDVVSIKWAPLTTCDFSIDDNLWYDIGKMQEHVKSKTFDMVIIDGPPAWEPRKQLARFPAIPFVKDKLENDFSIYLDDADRLGEQKVIELWKSGFGFNLDFSRKSFAYYQSGKSFCTDI